MPGRARVDAGIQPVVGARRSVGRYRRLASGAQCQPHDDGARSRATRPRPERLADRLVDGVLTIATSEHRSQLRNREAARERPADILAAAVTPPPQRRRPTRAGRGAVERRLADKRRRAQTKRLRRVGEDD